MKKRKLNPRQVIWMLEGHCKDKPHDSWWTTGPHWYHQRKDALKEMADADQRNSKYYEYRVAKYYPLVERERFNPILHRWQRITRSTLKGKE